MDLARRLLPTFLEELEEHLAVLRAGFASLPEIDRGAERDAHLADLFRAAHTLKGAARVVEQEAIEAAAQCLEAALGEARDGTLELRPVVLDAMAALVIELHDAGARLRDARDLDTGRLAAARERVAVRPGGGGET